MRAVRAGRGSIRSRIPRSCSAIIRTITGSRRIESAASRLEEAYRRLVLRDHVKFVERALGDSRARGRCSTWAAAAACFWA